MPACALVRPVTFFESLDVLPPEVRADLNARTGQIRTRSDPPDPKANLGPDASATPLLTYVAKARGQWLVGYMTFGFVLQDVTVSYLVQDPQSDYELPPENPKAHPQGALVGDPCTAANAFLKGVHVLPGWQKTDGAP